MIRNLLLVLMMFGFTAVGPLVGGAGFVYATGQGYIPTVDMNLMSALLLAVGCGCLVAVALLPTFVMAGFLGYSAGGQGFFLAALAMAIGIYGGIAFSRLFSRSLYERIMVAYPKSQTRIEQLQQAQGRRLLGLTFLTRLSPHMPFAATNLLFAQLKVPLLPLTVFSWLGMLPRTLLAVSLGAGIDQMTDLGAVKSELNWLGLFTVMLAVAVLWMARRYLQLPKEYQKSVLQPE